MHWKFLQRLVSHEKNSIIITEAKFIIVPVRRLFENNRH